MLGVSQKLAVYSYVYYHRFLVFERANSRESKVELLVLFLLKTIG